MRSKPKQIADEVDQIALERMIHGGGTAAVLSVVGANIILQLARIADVVERIEERDVEDRRLRKERTRLRKAERNMDS
jgi:hypothetical protein